MKNIIKKINIKYKKIKPYSYLLNFLIFASKIILFFLTKSYVFIISSLYNLEIGFAKKTYFNKGNFISVGIFLIMASISFILYSIYIIYFHKNVNYNLYTGITIATVTFYEIGYSIYGVIKSIKNNNKQNNISMLLSLAASLISLELTQSALLSFTQIGLDNSLYNGIIGIFAGSGSLIIGIIICLKKTNTTNY